MSTLVTLPNETLSQIILLIPANDIIAFSLMCKTTHSLSREAVAEHRRLTLTYRSVSFGDRLCNINGPIDSPVGAHPLILLREMIQDPRIAYYPTRLSVGYFHSPQFLYSGWHDREVEICAERWKSVERILDEFDEKIGSLITQCGYIQVEEHETWIRSIRRGDPEPVYILLLTMLPNLSHYRTINDPFGCSSPSHIQVCCEVLARIALSYKNTEEVVKGRPLTKMLEVEILPRHKQITRRELTSLAPFMALPSLQKLSGDGIVGVLRRPNHVGVWWKPSLRSSNLTEIDLRCSNIEEDAFTYILPHARKLKKFTHSFAGAHSDRIIVNALAEHCSKSLEYLHLTSEWVETQTCCHDQEGPVLKIGLPEKLEYLRVDYTLFYDYCQKGREKCTGTSDCECLSLLHLVDVLPTSIKAVLLEGEIPDQDIRRLLTDMMTLKPKSVPKLEMMCMESPLMASDLADRFDKVGIRLCTFGDDGVGEGGR